jgi:hypothetical protein
MGDAELLQAQGNVLEGDSDVDGAGGLDDGATARAVSIPVPFGLIMQDLQTVLLRGLRGQLATCRA